MSVSGISSSSQDSVHNAVAQAQNRSNEVKTQQASSSNASQSQASYSESSDSVALSDTASTSHRSSVASLDDEADESSPLFGWGKDKDTVSGGSGDDQIDITISEDGSCTVVINGEETVYSPDEAERLIIDGGRGNDTINLHGSYTSDIELFIKGGSGNDSIVADADFMQGLTIDGGKGRDYIFSGNGNDTIIDSDGDNTIYGNGGDDTISVGGWLNSSNNEIHGGDGNDTISANTSGINHLFGDDGNDTITGGSGHDYIEGGRGDDVLDGGKGNDVIYAGAGNDKVTGGKGRDFINAGSGDDIVDGGQGNDTIFGLSGDDKLKGGDGDDIIVGGAGADTIEGGIGSDTIRTTGGDTIIGSVEGDDIAELEPIEVPDNFAHFSADQSQNFQDIINDNLEAFASIEPGQQLLQGIAATGHQVTFQEEFTQNSFAQGMTMAGRMQISKDDAGNYTWTPGVDSQGTVGADSLVKINPSLINLGGNGWREYNSMVLMAHEMSHAYNNAMGNRDMSFYDNYTGERVELPEGATQQDGWAVGAVTGAEMQAVGLHDSQILSANPYGMSENDYREYFHMDIRESYMG